MPSPPSPPLFSPHAHTHTRTVHGGALEVAGRVVAARDEAPVVAAAAHGRVERRERVEALQHAAQQVDAWLHLGRGRGRLHSRRHYGDVLACAPGGGREGREGEGGGGGMLGRESGARADSIHLPLGPSIP